MRIPKRASIGALVTLLSCLISPVGVAVELPTIEPTSPLLGGGCFAPRCFPLSFALSGDTAAYANTDPALSVFVRTAGGLWQRQQVLTNPDFRLPTSVEQIQRALPFPPFGGSIALSGDSMLVSGTSSRHGFRDVVYVYRRTNGQWEHIQVLAPTRAPDATNTIVTSIAMDGDVALVSGVEEGGAPRAHVDVFIRRDDGTFLRRAIVRPPSVAQVTDGYTLSMSGNFALIGNPSAAQGNGRAYLYERAAGGWLLRRTFSPTAGVTAARFGTAVVIRNGRIAISAPEQPLAPNVFGAIHLYRRDGSTWQWDQMISPPEMEQSMEPTPPEPNQGWRFGVLLTFDGDRLAASSSFPSFELPPLGYVFERTSRGWSPIGQLSDNNATLNTRGLILSGSTLLLASADNAYNTPVYVFDLPSVGTEP